MTVAIMQPTYLPWAGYFNLIARVSQFVFLDDVQFAKPSWQMRNRILLQGKVHFISVPTLGSRNQLIADVRLSPEDWRSKHQRMLEHAYAKHPHGKALLDVVLPVLLDRSVASLSALNIGLIKAFSSALGLTASFLKSSELSAEGQRSSHLASILSRLAEQDYLSPPGSADYIAEDAVLEAAGVRVQYQQFDASPYQQQGLVSFEARLSIVDVVAHLGFEQAQRYVTQAREPSAPLEPDAHPRRPEARGPGLPA